MKLDKQIEYQVITQDSSLSLHIRKFSDKQMAIDQAKELNSSSTFKNTVLLREVVITTRLLKF